MRPSRLAIAHVTELLREYRGRSVSALRAMPPHEAHSVFSVGKRSWLISTEITDIDDGGVIFSLYASRQGFFVDWMYADGFVMNANGYARDLSREERRDLT